MTLPDLLIDLSRLGIKVSAKEGQLIVSAPKGTMTLEIMAALREHKPDLLVIFAPRAPDWVASPSGDIESVRGRQRRGPRDCRLGDRWLPWH
jgi:hypothetical protein